jgi:hypothetical protein
MRSPAVHPLFTGTAITGGTGIKAKFRESVEGLFIFGYAAAERSQETKLTR